MSGPVKPKRKNSEKRKEKSRDAARFRRNQETEIFCDLSHHLPLPYSLLSQLDKASIIRLSIAHIRLRTLFANANSFRYASNEGNSKSIDQQFYKALNGFVLVVEQRGDILYVSENVEKYLGISQVDIIGLDIRDFVHPRDHDGLGDLIANPCHQELQCVLPVRMKCTLTHKGRNINIKSADYKVITLVGSVVNRTWQTDIDNSFSPSYTVLIGRPIVDLVHSELMLDDLTFVCRLSLDLKFICCDKEITDLLGYAPGELIGESIYNFHHVYDAELLDKAYKSVFAMGQSKTGLYRFMAKNGGFVWMDTEIAMIGDIHSERSRSILCINHMVSDIECEDQILAEVQLNTNETSMEVVNECIVLEDDADEVILYEDDAEEEVIQNGSRIQLLTEKLLSIQGLPVSTDSNVAMCKLPSMASMNTASTMGCELLEENYAENELDPVPALDSLLDDFDCGLDMRAPYIPMDDTFFSMQTSLLEDVGLDSSPSPSDVGSGPLITTNAVDTDALNSLLRQFIDGSSGTTLQLASAEPEVDCMAYALAGNSDSNEEWMQHVMPGTKLNSGVGTSGVGIVNNPVSHADGSSVLRNLLTEGVDTNFGYCLSRPVRLAFERGRSITSETPLVQTSPSPPMKAVLLRHLLCSSSRAKHGGAANYQPNGNVYAAAV